ncbi:MAG: hypothetical protein ACI4EL_00310 [Candidatus Fimimorpha sp.]
MKLLKKYKEAVMVLLYGIFYMISFSYLEQGRTQTAYYIIHTQIDEWIPFCELFVVPYLLWFAYVGITLFYVTFINKDQFYKFVRSLVFGTITFIIISAVYPNMQDLRPTVFERDNIFVGLVRILYMTDTPTNVLPSLHVYMSLIANMTICDEGAFKKNGRICCISQLLCISIILSTIFIKQHSVIDVGMGIVMAYMAYARFYKQEQAMNRKWIEIWNN